MNISFESPRSPQLVLDAVARAQAMARGGKPWTDVLALADTLRLKHAILAGLISEEQSGNFSGTTVGSRLNLNVLVGDAGAAQRLSSPLASPAPAAKVSAALRVSSTCPSPAPPSAPTTGMLAAAATATAAALDRGGPPSNSDDYPTAAANSRPTYNVPPTRVEPPSRREMMQRLSRERLGFEVQDLYTHIVTPALVPVTPLGSGLTFPMPMPDSRDYSGFLSPRTAAAVVSGKDPFDSSYFASAAAGATTANSPGSAAASAYGPDSASSAASTRTKPAMLRVPVTIESDEEWTAENKSAKPALNPWPSWVTEGGARSVPRVRLNSADGPRSRSVSEVSTQIKDKSAAASTSALGSAADTPSDTHATGIDGPFSGEGASDGGRSGSDSASGRSPSILMNPIKSISSCPNIIDIRMAEQLQRPRSVSSAPAIVSFKGAAHANDGSGSGSPIILFESPLSVAFNPVHTGPSIIIPDGMHPALLYSSPAMRTAFEGARARTRSKSSATGTSPALTSPFLPASLGSPRVAGSAAAAVAAAQVATTPLDTFVVLSHHIHGSPLAVSPPTPEAEGEGGGGFVPPPPTARMRHPGGFSPVGSRLTDLGVLSPDKELTLSVVSAVTSAGLRLGSDASAAKLMSVAARARESAAEAAAAATKRGDEDAEEMLSFSMSSSRRLSGRAAYSGFPMGGGGGLPAAATAAAAAAALTPPRAAATPRAG